MDKLLKDILPDKDPYHNRGRDQMRKKGIPEFECLCQLPPVNILNITQVGLTLFLLASTQGASCRLVMNHLIWTIDNIYWY
jgi:hypothetical protein